jgi:predicted Zn finger-like uncharacterized protein
MIEIKCPNCKKSHRVPDDKIPSPAARVRCSGCKHVFVPGPNGNRVDASESRDRNSFKAKSHAAEIEEKQKEQTNQAKGTGFQKAFRTLGLDTDASLDQINESYVNACATSLHIHNGSDGKAKTAGRLYEINQAYELAMTYVKLRKPSKEAKPSQINRAQDAVSTHTIPRMPSQLEGVSQSHTDEFESLSTEIRKQGIFLLTYNIIYNHLSSFIHIIIKSSLLLFITYSFISFLSSSMTQYSHMMYGYSKYLWMISGVLYVCCFILTCIALTPLTIYAHEYALNIQSNTRNFVSVLLSNICFKMLKCYMFLSSTFVIGAIVLILPFFVLLYVYSDDLAVIVVGILGVALSLFANGVFVGRRLFLITYMVNNQKEPIFSSFRNIERLSIREVMLIWLMNFPLVIIGVICKLFQKYFDSIIIYSIMDYLISLNIAVMACVTMISISLFYIRNPNNREMMTTPKT